MDLTKPTIQCWCLPQVKEWLPKQCTTLYGVTAKNLIKKIWHMSTTQSVFTFQFLSNFLHHTFAYVLPCYFMIPTQLQIYNGNKNLRIKTLVNFKIWKHYFASLLLTLCGCTMVTSNFSILIISSSACTIASLIFQYSSPSSRGAEPLWSVLWVTLMTSLIFSGSSFTLPAR